MIQDDFIEICKLVCPHCRKGLNPSRRQDVSKEWQHQTGQAKTTITICWANGFRNSRFAEGIEQ